MTRNLFAALAVLVVCASTALGGALDGHAGAFDDGSKVWSGSTGFDNGTGVAGYVDWSVFAPGAFPFSGYTPTAGEMTYAFQVFNTGTDVISSFSVSLANVADNIGSFSDLSGDSTASETLFPLVKAEWVFSGMVSGNNSEGLAFSTPMVPQDLFGLVIDGGTFSVVIPLPSPSGDEIPEPVTLSLLGVGALALLRRKR